MLQDIRKSTQGTAAKVIIGLIVISFAAFGIESILLGGGGNSIAEVNGEEIMPGELQQALDTQKRRLIAMMGQNLDPAILDDDRLRPQAMEALISRKLMMQSAQALELAVSENEIGSLVTSMEQFQVNGAFSPDVYKSVLASAGYTPAFFKLSLRDDMLLNQLRSGLAGSEFATPTELAMNARILSEQRDLRYLTIPKEKFAAVTVSEEQVEAYYQDHQDEFRTPESVDLEFIELRLEDFHEPVAEETIVRAYETSMQDYQYQIQNRVSHILLEDGGDLSLEERLASASEQFAAGTDFADVARELSDDVGSASRGGDLGYSSGDAFPAEMEAAIAELEIGVISKPVQTDAGTHLLMVTERKDAEPPSLDEMRDQLTESIQKEEARVVLLRNVESLRDLSFNAEDLASPAQELALEVEQVEAIARNHSDGLFANPSLLEAAYSDEVLDARHNSEVIELAREHFVVLRVRAHHEPQVRPLDEVREQATAVISDSMARDAVAAEAERALAAIQGGQSLEEFAVSHGYDWQVELGVQRRGGSVAPEILGRVFELPTPVEGAGATDYIVNFSGDAQVIELVRVTAGEYDTLADAEKDQLQQLLSGEVGGLVNSEFQRALRDNAEITVM